MNGKQGYSITTWRMRLRCRHPEWLKQTQDFYNQIEKFYYDLLLEHEELWELNSQKTLRELEYLSLPGKEKRVPETPLPWEKVPPYFRRAAANAGIAAAKSYITRAKTIPGRKAEQLNSAAVYYKGMYRDFSADEITLKVWNTEQWQWMRCRLYGKDFPKDGQIMSPSVVFEYEFIMLHVPVKEATCDPAPVKVRMQEGRNICGLQFTNGDAFAVGSIQDRAGRELAVRFFKGGAEYSHHCRHVLEKIEKSEKSLGNVSAGRPNQKYWMHLKHLGEHYAHKISREIVRFCEEHEVGVIAVPKYDREYSRYVMGASGDWSPIHLSMRIREYLSYKAWQAGMIVIEVNAKGISSACGTCGGQIVNVDKRSMECVCENGHRCNRYLNAARNLTRKCRGQFETKTGVKEETADGNLEKDSGAVFADHPEEIGN